MFENIRRVGSGRAVILMNPNARIKLLRVLVCIRDIVLM